MAPTPPPCSPYLGQTSEAGPSTVPLTATASRRTSRPYSPGPQSPLRSPSTSARRVSSSSTPGDENRPGRRNSPSGEGFRNTIGRISLFGPSSSVRGAPPPPPSSNLGCSPSMPPSPHPPPVPIPGSPLSRPGSAKKPTRGLSLNIPPGSLAYGGLTPATASLGSGSSSAVAPPVSALEGPASIAEAVEKQQQQQQQQQQQTSTRDRNNDVENVHVYLSPASSQRQVLSLITPSCPPKTSSSVKKRPARLDLAPSPLLSGFVAQQGNVAGQGKDEEAEGPTGFGEKVVSQELLEPSASPRGQEDMSHLPQSSASTLPRRRQALNAPVEASSRGDSSPTSAKCVGVELSPIQPREKQYLRNTLTGRPRRRPSMPFPNLRPDRASSAVQLSQPVSNKSLPDPWRDPSEHPLSGEGSSLQHARSVYAAGPIEVLPGLFLGDEYNARDDELLADYDITTILDVAKETISPLQAVPHTKNVGSRSVGLDRSPSTVPAQIAQRRRPSFGRSITLDDPAFEEDEIQVATATRRGNSSNKDHTPSATSFPEDALLTPLQRSPSRINHHLPAPSIIDYEHEHAPALPTHLLRNALSTPHLQLEFFLDGQGSQREPSNDPMDEDSETQASDQGTNSISSKASSTTTDATSPGTSSEAGEKRLGVPQVEAREDGRSPIERLMPPTLELPKEALISTIPASPLSGRPQAVNYVKLPWTHEQTELAAPGGGFAQGCAIVAQSLGIDYFGRPLIDAVTGEPVKRRNILVHCQCGVSRSATLTIAFVMQSAALNYPFEQTRNLTGMHDCYNLVKDLSSSVSPNISLIYQLVEWERHLSNEAARLREALMASTEEQLQQSGLLYAPATDSLGVSGENEDPTITSSAAVVAAAASGDKKLNMSRFSSSQPSLNLGWSSDTMGEEEWTRMRREEERKEAMEQADRKRLVEEEAKRQTEERQRKGQGLEEQGGALAHAPSTGERDVAGSPGKERTFNGGLCARRRKQAPSLQLGASRDGRQSRGGIVPALTLTSSSSNSGSGGVGTTSTLSSDLDNPLQSARLDGAFPSGSRISHEQNMVESAEAVGLSPSVPLSLLTRSLERKATAEEHEPRAANDDSEDEPLRTATLSSSSFGNLAVKGTPISASVELGRASEGVPATLPDESMNSASFRGNAGGRTPKLGIRPPQAHPSAPPFLQPGAAADKVGARRSASYHSPGADAGADPSKLEQQTRPPFPGIWSMRQSLSQGSIHPSESSARDAAPESLVQQGLQQLQPPLSFRPKINFGLMKGGLSSAERKMQHRRTFSSEVNWETLTTRGGGAVAAPGDSSAAGSSLQAEEMDATTTFATSGVGSGSAQGLTEVTGDPIDISTSTSGATWEGKRPHVATASQRGERDSCLEAERW